MFERKSDYWKHRYGQIVEAVKDKKCDTCGEEETTYHFLKCRAHEAIRREMTKKVISILNKHLKEEISAMPVFWAEEQKGRRTEKSWREVESADVSHSAMGLIPQAFVDYLSALEWKQDTDHRKVIGEVQFTIVQGHKDSWNARCKKFYDKHRGVTNLEERTRLQIATREHRREERDQQKQENHRKGTSKRSKRPQKGPPDKSGEGSKR